MTVRSRLANVAEGAPPPEELILYLAVKMSGVFAGRPVSTIVALARVWLLLVISYAFASDGTGCAGVPPVTATLMKAFELLLLVKADAVMITSALVAAPGRPDAYATVGPTDAGVVRSA
jgi:hypothetical protein